MALGRDLRRPQMEGLLNSLEEVSGLFNAYSKAILDSSSDSRPPDMGSAVNDTFSPDGASEHRQICLKATILPSNPAKNVYHGIF